MTHTIGNIYKVHNNTMCLLSGFLLDKKDHAVLIELETGNRYVDPIAVKDYYRITDDEMTLLTGGDTYSLI